MLQRWMGIAGFFGRGGAAATGREGVTASIVGLGSFTVDSYSWGTDPEGVVGAGGGGGGKAKFSKLFLNKPEDALTPLLRIAADTAEHFKSAELVVRSPSKPTVIARLKDVNIWSVLEAGNGQDHVELTFAELSFEQGGR